jgi:hypothetical protein
LNPGRPEGPIGPIKLPSGDLARLAVDYGGVARRTVIAGQRSVITPAVSISRLPILVATGAGAKPGSWRLLWPDRSWCATTGLPVSQPLAG